MPPNPTGPPLFLNVGNVEFIGIVFDSLINWEDELRLYNGMQFLPTRLGSALSSLRIVVAVVVSKVSGQEVTLPDANRFSPLMIILILLYLGSVFTVLSISHP